jgi:hypothetical protein
LDLSALSLAERDALITLLLKAKAAAAKPEGEDRPRAGSNGDDGSETKAVRH